MTITIKNEFIYQKFQFILLINQAPKIIKNFTNDKISSI